MDGLANDIEADIQRINPYSGINILLMNDINVLIYHLAPTVYSAQPAPLAGGYIVIEGTDFGNSVDHISVQTGNQHIKLLYKYVF